MPSTYSSDLRLELMADGEQASLWGQKTNTNLELIEDAISGMTTVATTGGDTTLTATNGAADESRRAVLKITGALVSNSNILVPASTKRYTVWNATSGSYTVTVKTAAGTGIAVAQGYVAQLFCDATNVIDAQTGLGTVSIGTVASDVLNTSTGALQVSSGTTAQRASGAAGKIRFNTDLNAYEGADNGGSYNPLGGGATGGSGNAIFHENDTLVAADYTIGSGALQTCTISNATPAVVTMTNAFIAGQPVIFTTTGALPTGLATDTVYYVMSAGLSSSAFQVSATDGGAAINTSSAGSGTHKCGKVKNAITAGPASVATGYTVTIPSGSTWSIV